MQNLKIIATTAILSASCLASVVAFDIPQYDNYVTDTTKILTLEQEKNLEDQIYAIRKNTATEIWILIIPSTNGEDIAQVATDVGNTRWIGTKKYDNGIIILLAINDRKRFTAVGYWLEGTLPDAIVKRIGESNFPEHFKQGQYFEGLQAALQDINAYILKDPTVTAYYKNNKDTNTSQTQDFKKYSWIMFFLGFILAGIFFTKKRVFRKNLALFTGIWWGVWLIFWLLTSAFLLAIWSAYLYLIIGIIVVQLRSSWMFFMWWWRNGGGFWWGSSFGWFWWGSFWWGWGGGKR